MSIVNYSYNRGVILVPEIDVPGHSMQFLKYPEIFQLNNDKASEDLFGNKKEFVNVINMGKEEVYSSLEKLFTEV